MTLREFIALDVLNIASTEFGFVKKHQGFVYRATARQCAAVLRDDPRFLAERRAHPEFLNARSMGATYRRLAKGWPTRRDPLVSRTQTGHWSLTNAGARALSA